VKILRHFTANDEQLKPFPFKRELSMESYLVENEGVLVLDDDLFYDVDIVEEELTLKQGRLSKDTDGRIDILITYSQECIGVVELKLGELEEIHLEQLEDYLLQRGQIIDQYPNILNKEISSDPKWIGVLVGSSISPELADKIKKGYVTESGIPIAALTIQRFRSAKGNVYVTTDTYFHNSNLLKDSTKYQFNGKSLGKGRLVLSVIREHIEANPHLTFSELDRVFPKSCQGSQGVFSTLDDADDIYVNTNRARHFLKPNEVIKLSDSIIAVSSQWGIGNIDKFIAVAIDLGYNITKD
jgi:hypothetical protein